MEYFWLIIASIGAGVGTGLAGLSAATVMVPILITLCTSFAGEGGVYQATAIALASDILASAVTTITYAKNKNIDLKRGWIMLVCILTMCTIGSYVAWIAGNTVLGNFTLILTLCIGIRFLIKPDTTKKEIKEKGNKLGIKEILISLFFGLTIGFGTGFVGTGGGMMMLVVFTLFLGMDLKTGVGTSTFIMTFTALIASISHIIISPEIVMNRWDALLLCVVVTTISALASAKFANRVKNRTVGLVTGAILTILGISMIILNYWSVLSTYLLFVQVLQCLGMFLLYIIPCIIVLLLLFKIAKVPKFIFRKLLHIVAFTSIILMIVESANWQVVSLSSIIIAIIIYPILAILEKEKWYNTLFVQKKNGEIKHSLLLLFFMFAFISFVAWEIFGKQYMAVASILMWGIGDAFAALIGIPFGKHKIVLKHLKVNKSWEGSIAMLISSLVCGFLILYYMGGLSFLNSLLMSLVSAIVGTFVELISPSEYDTVTVPISILGILLLLVH